MAFENSKYSTLTEDDYGAASTDWVEIKDVPGDSFRVYSDGTVEHVRTGTTWAPTANVTTYNQVIANLADVPGNKEKMESVLGSGTVTTAVMSAAPYAAPAGPVDDAMPVGSVPLTQQWWFLPAALGGASLVLAGVSYLYVTQTESGKEQWAKLTRKNPAPASKPKVLSVKVVEVV